MEKTGLVLGIIIRRISGLGHCFNKIDWIAVGKIRELVNCYCVSCNRKIVVRKLLLWKLQLGNSWMWKLLLWKLQLGNCSCGNCYCGNYNWKIFESFDPNLKLSGISIYA